MAASSSSSGKPVDILVIGGGVNGCGIARDAAGRGYSVTLCESGDLASGTSSASTKLVHGGLRYLEHYEFRLVREALREREVLLAIAPHLVRPLRFVLPHDQSLRPAWLIRAGLLIYDHCYRGRTLPGTRTLDLRHDAAGAPLKARYTRAFEYSDCTVDDARLVVLNARDAADRGAHILTRTMVEKARRAGDLWEVTVRDTRDETRQTIAARVIVNAAGPHVAEVLANRLDVKPPAAIRLVRGSHIVVPRLFEHDRAYIFQNEDRRIVFAIPYQRRFTLIGTTDRDQASAGPRVVPDAGEIAYLCEAASRYFRTPVGPQSVVWSFAGLRPLHDDGSGEAQAATRDYELFLDTAGAPVLSVYGGKITTYRRLALAAMRKLKPMLSPGAEEAKDWTGTKPLPGGDLGAGGLGEYTAALLRDYAWLGAGEAERLAQAYGTVARQILARARSRADLGADFGGGLSEAEATYLIQCEWAESAEDVVWRRTKLGLSMNAGDMARLEAWAARGRGGAGARQNTQLWG
jgi:glycerol-3-phosphate dehydrogenase